MLAILADAAQILVFPVFLSPILEPLNAAFDLAMALVFIALLGWHWAFLPAFISEAIPVWDLVPTWTAAVFLATRGATSRTPETRSGSEVTVVPPPRLPPGPENKGT
jgi:hypothetical protein